MEKPKNGNKGFTMIEIVFVLAIFFLIIGVTISIFLIIVKEQKRILGQQELVNQGSFAFEYMSKALRMATIDTDGSCLGTPGKLFVLTQCEGGTPNLCHGIRFINQADSNACQEFFLDTASAPQWPVLKETKNGLPAQILLSTSFWIYHADFVLNGDSSILSAGSQDAIQSRVTILLNVQDITYNPSIGKTFQTTVSLRNLNIP